MRNTLTALLIATVVSMCIIKWWNLVVFGLFAGIFTFLGIIYLFMKIGGKNDR